MYGLENTYDIKISVKGNLGYEQKWHKVWLENNVQNFKIKAKCNGNSNNKNC